MSREKQWAISALIGIICAATTGMAIGYTIGYHHGNVCGKTEGHVEGYIEGRIGTFKNLCKINN